MDDFKPIGKLEKEFQKDIQRVKTCTNEQHRFHKCEQTELKEDKLVHWQNSIFDFNKGMQLEGGKHTSIRGCGKGRYIITYERQSKNFLI